MATYALTTNELELSRRRGEVCEVTGRCQSQRRSSSLYGAVVKNVDLFVATPAAAEKATKQTAAQRRQAKARLEAAAQASRDVENLLRKCASEWVPLPVSKLPTLYAEEYGRHRPLSLPSWEESLKELPTCHLIETSESDGDTDGPWVLWIGDGSQEWS